ncbi:MAG TPA: hypothetical protein VLX90_14830 [Steroidobacteraceae bacterium]|nr:hypothetical protein [Steroidobacteraceae bacterium]
MKALPSLAAIALLAAAPVYADCSYPTPPEKIPDGNSATLEEMVTAQKAVKEYDKAINAYVACIKLEHDDAVTKGGDKLTKEQLADMERVEVQKHNAAIDQLQSIADRFNEQVKVYKAKNDKSKS